MNKVILIGNLTRDPEIRTTQSGMNVCNFSIAVNRRAKDGQQDADFISITAWKTLGDLCQKYLSKGKKVSVVGRIQTRTYEAQDGTKRSAFEVVAEEVEFLTPAGQNNNQSGYTQAVSKEPEFTQVDDTPLPF